MVPILHTRTEQQRLNVAPGNTPWAQGRAAFPVVVLELLGFLLLSWFAFSDHSFLRLCTCNIKLTWPQMFCAVVLQAAVVPGGRSTYLLYCITRSNPLLTASSSRPPSP